LGLEKGLDVSIYNNPGFNYSQMDQIRRGLVKKIDVSYYTNTQLDWRQMREIRLGLEVGIDISNYIDISDSTQMREVRLMMQREIIKKLREDIINYFNIKTGSDYVKSGINPRRLKNIQYLRKIACGIKEEII
jgi:hypothetical protein